MSKPNYIVKLNGQTYGTTPKKTVAEEVAEKLWSQGRGETEVVREDDNSIICQFEV